jgi:hypothetical protein
VGALLEVPAELVNHFGSERRQQLVPRPASLADLFEGGGRHHDPEHPRAQRTKHRSMAFEEDAELVNCLRFSAALQFSTNSSLPSPRHSGRSPPPFDTNHELPEADLVAGSNDRT